MLYLKGFKGAVFGELSPVAKIWTVLGETKSLNFKSARCPGSRKWPMLHHNRADEPRLLKTSLRTP
jgi:hypothetical protein